MFAPADTNSEPSLLLAAWRHRWLVVTTTGAAVAFGLLFHFLRPSEPTYEAEANLLIQEPVVTAEGVALQTASEPFVAAQVEIIRSDLVMSRATRILQEETEGDDPVPTAEIEVTRTAQSPLVSVSAIHADPTVAVSWANTVAAAYASINREQVTAANTAGLELIDAQLAQIATRLEEIETELSELRSENPDVVSIEDQADEAIARIAELQPELVEEDDPDAAAAIRTEIADLRARLDTYLQVLQTAPAGAEGQALEEEQSQLLDRRAQLLARSDEIAVDSDLSPDALAMLQEATEAVSNPVGRPARIVAVAIVLGVLAGVGLAYLLAVWRRSFAGRNEPEGVIGAPLLAEVPSFTDEGVKSQVAVRDFPRSATAEAYRFAAGSLEVAARANEISTFAMVSATIGQGKTTTVVNTALAAAGEGRSVAVVDCDFGNQEATRLLLGSNPADQPGITDVVDENIHIDEATVRISFGNEVEVSLIGRGTRPRLAASVLRSIRAREFFAELRQSYDLVLIDSPPMLQVAYASTLVEYAQGVVVVINHQSLVSESQDLVSRLQLIGTPIIGYVYNGSPLRPEMTVSKGSMMDVLGDSGLTTSVESRRR